MQKRQVFAGTVAYLSASPLSPLRFRREWEILQRGENFRKYWTLTVVETTLPCIFAALFAVVFVSGF